jgi:hypothetical protein
VIGWFDEEIQALPTAVIKANKNFLCYCIAGVLRMLYENGCSHVDELQTLMNSCNASILDDIPEEIGRLAGRIVWKWWATYGLPYVTVFSCDTRGEDVFHLLRCLHIMLILTSVFVGRCRWRM